MKILSINSNISSQNTNSATMNGRLQSKRHVVKQVLSFFKENHLQLKGNTEFNPSCKSPKSFSDVFVTQYNSIIPLRIKDDTGSSEIILSGKSINDLVYKFAKLSSGKTLFDFMEHYNMLRSGHNGHSIKSYRPTIKVPDFFN